MKFKPCCRLEKQPAKSNMKTFESKLEMHYFDGVNKRIATMGEEVNEQWRDGE